MPDAAAIRAGRAAVEISGDDTQLKAATERSKGYLKQVGQAAAQTGKETNQGFLANLAMQAKLNRKEKRASGESALEKALSSGGGLTNFAAESLGVGLPMMVTGAIGDAFKESTSKILEMRQALKEGKITQEEMVRGLAEGIPILGSFVSGFMNIREMITGEKTEIAEVNAEAKRTTEIFEAQYKAAQKLRDILRELHTTAAKTTLAAGAVGKDEFTQQRSSIAQARVDLTAKRDEGGKKQAEEYDKEKDAQIKGLEEEARIADQKLAEFQKAVPDYKITDSQDKKNDPLFKEVYDQLAGLTTNSEGAHRRLQGARTEKKTGHDQIIADTGAALDAQEKKLDAEAADVEKRYAEAWGQAGRAAALALDQALASGAATRLRNRGQEYQAEKTELDQALKQQLAAIDQHTREELKRFGVTDQKDPRYGVIVGQGESAKSAATEGNAAQQEAAANKEWNRRRQQALTLQQLQNEALEDHRAREVATLDVRYRAEVDEAMHAGKETLSIFARWEQEKANLVQRHAREKLEQAKANEQSLLALQLESLDNAQQRELALLDAKYQAEYQYAQRHPDEKDPNAVLAQWQQAHGNLVKQQAQQVGDAQRAMDVEIEHAQNAVSKRGLAQRLADLEIERRERLRQEADPRFTTGVGAAKIQQLYDLKRQQELMQGRSAAGSFSARELGRMGGNQPLDEIAQHTRNTAANTKKLVQHKSAFS